MIWRTLFVAALSGGLLAQAAPERPQILGIARVVFRVSSIAPAREFYGHSLGLAALSAAAGGCVRYRVNDRQPEVQPPATACAAASPRALWVKDPDGHLLAFVESHPAKSVGAEAHSVSTRVLHAGLTIRDPQAADAFYKEVLGFSEIWRGGRTDDETSWINMKVPNGTDYLEYMLVTGPISRQQRGSLHHVAMLVPDIQVALETVRNRTAPEKRTALASPQVGRNKRWQLNLFDPDGTRTELMEPYTMR
jgi:catechol 2,3-dioxygenase-like lactoylglutathione lyase family enzyme